METDLATVLLAGRPHSDPETDRVALHSRLQSMLTAARSAWPAIALEDDDYVRHVARVLPASGDVGEALAAIHSEDIFLACACTLGVSEALAVFEREILRPSRAVLARASDVVDRDEFLQRLRERLLVAPKHEQPRLAGFSGRGRLANWVRIVAQRLLIDEFRRRDAGVAEVSVDAMEPLHAVGADPEVGVLQRTYREGFQAAFEASFAKLTVRERTLLRYRYVDGLEVNQIASVAGRHRVSVYRALIRARESLLEHLRRGMADRLQLGGSEADSVLRLMRSQLDVRISRLFESS